jgi:two-component system, cell cycle sensor histidine kinase and response regulator CckA
MIESRRTESAPQLHHDFDAMAAAARRAVRGRRAPLEALNAYLAAHRVAALVADDGGCYIGANEAACRLTGYSLNELLALSIPDLTAPEDAAPGERLWNSFVRSDDQRGTFTISRKGGAPVRVVYHAYKDIADGIHLSFLLPADDASSA